MIPPIKKQTRAMKPLTASWSEPLNPCPLGHPSARRAPNMATIPPTKATTARLAVLRVPNLSAHISGTACSLNEPEVTAEIIAPRKMPRTNIHCQSILGATLIK